MKKIKIIPEIKFSEVTNIELGGVDMKDYPDFCDAYVENELEEFSMLEETMSYINENAYESLF